MAFASKRDRSTGRVNVVLVGLTGDGKSTTGCTIANDKKAFEKSGGWQSQTQRCSHCDFEIEGKQYRIIDTPGLSDTNLTAQELHERFRGFCDLAPDGVDCFLFVLRQGRFRPENMTTFNAFKEACTQQALKHSMIVVSGVEDLDEEYGKGITQREFIEDLHEQAKELPNLKNCLGQVNDRVIGVENHGGKELREKGRHLVVNMVEKIRSENNYERYENEALKEAEKWRESIKKAVQELESKEARETMINELSDCFNGRKPREAVKQKLKQLQAAQENLNEIKQKGEDAEQRANVEADKAERATKLKEEAMAVAKVARDEAVKAKEDADKAEADAKQKIKAAEDRSNAARRRDDSDSDIPRRRRKHDSSDDEDDKKKGKEGKQSKNGKKKNNDHEPTEEQLQAWNKYDSNVARAMVHYNITELDDLTGKTICCRGALGMGHYHAIIDRPDFGNSNWILQKSADYDAGATKKFKLTCNWFCEKCGPFQGPSTVSSSY